MKNGDEEKEEERKNRKMAKTMQNENNTI